MLGMREALARNRCGPGASIRLTAGVLVLAGGIACSSSSDSAVAAGSTGSSSTSATAGGRRGNGPVSVPVTTAHVVAKRVPEMVQTVGSVEPITTVAVRAQVGGTLTSVSFTEGQDVTAGQRLFTIDPQPYQVALQQAQATLARDVAQSKNAEAIRQRDEGLLKRGIMAPADYETAVSQAAALQGSVAADQAQVDAAALQLQYTTISTPVSGRTGALLVQAGNLIRTTDTSPLVVINQIAPIRVAFAVPGQYLSKVRSGQAASPLATTARAAGSHDTTSEGAVSFIDNAVDPKTGTITLKSTFTNDDRRLWPGELVEVSLELSVDPHAVVVPSSAVQNGQQGQFVYVVLADRTVALHPVVIARTNGDDAIVTSGVAIGDEVVTDGQLGLVPGAHVSIKPSAGSTAARGDHP